MIDHHLMELTIPDTLGLRQVILLQCRKFVILFRILCITTNVYLSINVVFRFLTSILPIGEIVNRVLPDFYL